MCSNGGGAPSESNLRPGPGPIRFYIRLGKVISRSGNAGNWNPLLTSATPVTPAYLLPTGTALNFISQHTFTKLIDIDDLKSLFK